MMDRRAVLCGGIAASAMLCAPSLLAATLAARRYRIWRGEDEIGVQTVQLFRAGERLRVEIGIDIRVKLLGITVYRYGMRNVEHWVGGRLVDLNARTDDDGNAHSVTIVRRDAMLHVTGTGFEGEVAGDAATTTYWSPDFLRRKVWISTHDGTPLKISTARRGIRPVVLATGMVEADCWSVAGDLTMDLFYAGGEWVANQFRARGQQARVVAEDLRTPLSPFFAA